MSKLTAVAALALIAAFLAPAPSRAQNTTSSLVSESATTATAKNTANKKAGKKKNAKKAALKPAGNANCPVSGHPVGSMQAGSHVVYKGYKVGLCCDSCKERFMADADANLQKALNEKKQ